MASSQLLAYGELSSLAANTPTLLATYNPEMSLTSKFINHIACSGSFYAEFQLFVDLIKIETRRSGPGRNVDFEFAPPLFLKPFTSISVYVVHYKNDLGQFEASIFHATKESNL